MNNNEKNNSTPKMPIFMCLGLSVGMAIGAGFGNISIGMCIGVIVGSIFDSRNKDKEDSENSEEE